MAPQQLACPKCGCLLAHFDTDVRRECPVCGHRFTRDTPPVFPVQLRAPKPAPQVRGVRGCGYALLAMDGYFLVFGLAAAAVMYLVRSCT